jgi:hypothetical protein
MDAGMLAQLKQRYAQNLARIAAGAGGNPDPFTPALDQLMVKGWTDEIPVPAADEGEPAPDNAE